MLAPKSYPGGFPLLLSPVYWLFGNNILAFKYLMGVLLVIEGILWFELLKKYTTDWFAALAILLLLLCQWSLRIESTIYAEVPFSACLAGFFLVANKSTKIEWFKRHSIILKTMIPGLIAGLLISLKIQGLIVILTYLGLEVISHSEKNRRPGSFMEIAPRLLLFSLTAAAVFVGVNFISGVSLSDLSSYKNNFIASHFITQVIENLTIYSIWLIRTFSGGNHFLGIFRFLFPAILTLLFLVGIFESFLRKQSRFALYFLAYVALMIIYPYQGYPFRLLYPILPLALLFIYRGLENLARRVSISIGRLSVFILIAAMIQILPPGITQLQECHTDTTGPDNSVSQQAFEWINQNIKPEKVIEFDKPRSLVLYTNKASFAFNPDGQFIPQELQYFHPSYILTDTALTTAAISTYLQAHQNAWRVTWKNRAFLLYEKIEKSAD